MIFDPRLMLMALRDSLISLPILPIADPALALEVALADEDERAERVELWDGRMLRVHPPEQCEGQPCCIHDPSYHPLREAPLNWRSPYLMERICEHGIGHPDPDHLDYLERAGYKDLAWEQGIHGCDGCCRA